MGIYGYTAKAMVEAQNENKFDIYQETLKFLSENNIELNEAELNCLNELSILYKFDKDPVFKDIKKEIEKMKDKDEEDQVERIKSITRKLEKSTKNAQKDVEKWSLIQSIIQLIAYIVASILITTATPVGLAAGIAVSLVGLVELCISMCSRININNFNGTPRPTLEKIEKIKEDINDKIDDCEDKAEKQKLENLVNKIDILYDNVQKLSAKRDVQNGVASVVQIK